MSWSRSYPTRSTFNADEPQGATEIDTLEMQEQVDIARAAARSIIESGAVGTQDKDLSISLFGHANPGHEPAKGWSNDYIQINISQVVQSS